jgi:hypothetical protein
MWMWFCDKCKLVHHVGASQVVVAPTINDHVMRSFFDDTLYLKQCVTDFAPLSQLCTKHVLHN